MDARFEDFCDRFCSFPWTDLNERPKLARAVQKLCKRMPDNTYENLPHLTVHAPPPGIFGEVRPTPGHGLVIYFAPQLERESQKQNDFTVAHEFAHAALGHGTAEWFSQSHTGDIDNGDLCEFPCEYAADELAESWGYEIPKYRRGAWGRTFW